MNEFQQLISSYWIQTQAAVDSVDVSSERTATTGARLINQNVSRKQISNLPNIL